MSLSTNFISMCWSGLFLLVFLLLHVLSTFFFLICNIYILIHDIFQPSYFGLEYPPAGTMSPPALTSEKSLKKKRCRFKSNGFCLGGSWPATKPIRFIVLNSQIPPTRPPDPLSSHILCTYVLSRTQCLHTQRTVLVSGGVSVVLPTNPIATNLSLGGIGSQA